MTHIAVLGHGVVGSGVVEVFNKNHAGIVAKAGDDMEIKYILDLQDFPNLPYSGKFIKDFDRIVNDPDISVVVEVMGGLKPAYEYVKRSLLAGKSVVTSNKELVAAKGGELLAIAQDKNVNFLFEASVGGGIPILRPISQCLAANDIFEIVGILNGTTNFILTKMFKEGMGFEDSLALAQQLGYAERDPSADVDGHDACRKICILASLAFGHHIYPAQVYTEGIRKISPIDVSYASSCGAVIKLIGIARRADDQRLSCLVAPMLVKGNSQLSSVDDVFNAIMVRGDATGDVLFYGRGAGKLPTASAVVADVIDCVKHFNARKYLIWNDGSEEYVADHLDDETALYIRVKTPDSAAAMEAVKAAFGSITPLSSPQAPAHELAFMTQTGRERDLRCQLKSLSRIVEPISVMRICE